MAVLSKDEDFAVYVTAVVEWDVAICRLGSPNFGWDVNHERPIKRGGVRRSVAGDGA